MKYNDTSRPSGQEKPGRAAFSISKRRCFTMNETDYNDLLYEKMQQEYVTMKAR